MNGWTVFNTAANNTMYTSTVTIDSTGTTVAPGYFTLPQMREALALPDDPLRWLHDKVAGVCALGRLDA